MSQYDNTNTGALFVNDKRETDRHPNAKGTINVEGVEYWVSAWTKTSASGARYQSLSLTKKDQQATPQKAPAASAPAADFDDDMPF